MAIAGKMALPPRLATLWRLWCASDPVQADFGPYHLHCRTVPRPPPLDTFTLGPATTMGLISVVGRAQSLVIEGSLINRSHQRQLSPASLRLDDEIVTVIRGSPGDLVSGTLIGTYGQNRRRRPDDLKDCKTSKPPTRYH